MEFINYLKNYIYHKLNPHCDECLSIQLEIRKCQSCETLKEQLRVVNSNNQLLLETLSKQLNPIQETNNQVNEAPIELPKRVSWHVMRQRLEEASREAAQAKKEAAQPDSTKNDKIPDIRDEMNELDKEIEDARTIA